MRGIKYPHLQLIDWPFRTVPDETSCSFIADRIGLHSDLNTLLEGLSRQQTSSIHLMWAWFGAGKTHTLYYIKHLCKNIFKNIIPIYIEFPKSIKNFVDIYKLFISKLDMDLVDEAYVNVFGDKNKDKIQKELIQDYPDLAAALKFHFMGNEQQKDLAIRWFRVEISELRSLKTIGIFRPIQTDEDVMKIISWIIHLINIEGSSGEAKRVILMLDEYQRISSLRKPTADKINGCLHSILNRCPNGLSIIVSFSGYPQKKLPEWLSPEIRDRLDRKHILLPPLSKSEALIFVKDILNHFKFAITSGDEYFPFNLESIQIILKKIEDEAKEKRRVDEPKPRTIMHAFNIVLREAEPKIKEGELQIINREFAQSVLEGISLIEEGI